MDMFMLIDPEWIIRELHRPCVQKGAVWLDEYVDKWTEKIIPAELDLSSTDACICGQIFGDFGNRPDFVYEAHDFGFTTRQCEIEDLFSDSWNRNTEAMAWRALDTLWLDEIYWRRSEEAPI